MRNGRLLPKGKREYFVHKCMKILAKRKRGNKFPLRGKDMGGKDKQRRGNKLGNKSLKGMNVMGAYGENGQ
jgi:hypothetical protein